MLFIFLFFIGGIAGGVYYLRNDIKLPFGSDMEIVHTSKDGSTQESESETNETDGSNLDTSSEKGEIQIVIKDFLLVSTQVLEEESISIVRFWFSQSFLDSEPYFYVEYEDQKGTLSKSLIERKSKGTYKLVGKFFAGMNEWELDSGEDILYGKELVLYENTDDDWFKVE
jgi:hypothetical protein